MKGLFAKLLGRYRETDFLFPERLFMRLENHVSQSKMRLLSVEIEVYLLRREQPNDIYS